MRTWERGYLESWIATRALPEMEMCIIFAALTWPENPADAISEVLTPTFHTLRSTMPEQLLSSGYATASQFTKAVSSYFSQCSLSWKLNAAPYLCSVHKPCLLLREETVPTVRVVNLRFRLCTSLVPRPTSVVFCLGTRLHVRMRTKLENGVLHNRQQPQSVVNGFYWPGWIWSYEDAEWSYST